MAILDKLCKEDDETVASTIYNEYWYAMYILGLYPKMDTPKWRLFSGIQFLSICSLFVYFTVIMAVTAIKIKDNLMGLCQCTHYAFILTLVMTMLITMNRCRINFARIHRGIGTGLSDYDQVTEDCRHKLRLRIKKYKGRLIKIYFIYLILGLIFLGIIAIVVDDSDDSENELYITNGVSLDLPIPQWSPFSTDTMFTYLIATSLQVIVCTVVSTIACGFDMLFLTVASNIAMELDVLIISLEKLPERTLHLFQLRHGAQRSRLVDITRIRDDKDLSECYAHCLKQNVIHHQRIIQMFNDLSTLMSVLLFLALSTGGFYIAISGALILFAQGRTAARVASAAFCIAEIANIFFHCWCAELIIDGSVQLSRTLYSTNWMITNKGAAHTVLIMLTRANQPFLMTCNNLLKINFETFANIMNSAYSFFNLLNAVEEEVN